MEPINHVSRELQRHNEAVRTHAGANGRASGGSLCKAEGGLGLPFCPVEVWPYSDSGKGLPSAANQSRGQLEGGPLLCRRTYGSYALAANGNLFAVAAQMGHVDGAYSVAQPGFAA